MAKRSNESLYEFSETKSLGDKSKTNRLNALLREAHSLRDAIERLKKVKEEIVELAQGYEGLRFGKLCVCVRWQDGRRTLNRELLVENGVTPQQIELSMKQGEGGWVCELPQIEGE